MTIKTLNAICAAFVLTLVPMQVSLACSCVMGRTQKDMFDEAEYVAQVKITGAELREMSELGKDDAGSSSMSSEYVRVSFEEVEVFKSAGFSPIYLKEIPYHENTCMIGLRPGLEYVVFLTKGSKGFVWGCSGSFRLDDRSNKSQEINELRKLANDHGAK
jgi:hypothetical protein